MPITVTTPSSVLTIRGGIMLFKVAPTETTATSLFGHEMTVSGAGGTRHVTTPGWQVSAVAGQAPALPIPAPRGGLTQEMRRLEAPGARPGDGAADRAAQRSGFADRNSGLGPNARGPIQGGPQPRPGDGFGPPRELIPRPPLPPGPADPPR